MSVLPAKVMPKSKRKLAATPDTVDFRDLMFVPTLIQVARERPLRKHLELGVPVLDQGKEGSCTGFALATVVNTLTAMLDRRLTGSASPHMLYEMAKRYDEWPGENYEGSSARGAMKGWHKHGVCAEQIWKGSLNRQVSEDALSRPLGAYYRVNHKDLVSVHSALQEVGILYATTAVHEGWDNLGSDGFIPVSENMLGAHAVAIVGYDAEGLWLQNSWGKGWGKEGFARISYDDWVKNGTDLWVSRLGVPVVAMDMRKSAATMHSAAVPRSNAPSLHELRRHIVSIGNDGKLDPSGDYGTSASDVDNVVAECKAALTGWQKSGEPGRVLLYAHGGLVDETSAVQVLADFLPVFMAARVYPISFIWHSDFWSTLKDILADAFSRRRPEGFLDSAKDFMLDRLDDALEPLAKLLGGKSQWDEMKENAAMATTSSGGARYLVDRLVSQVKNDLEIHLVGHSAGSIFHAALAQYLATDGKIAAGPMAGQSGLGVPIKSCTLWAPACTVELFKQTYLPLLGGGIERLTSFILTDQAEQDDNCARIYNKSLLYLVSDAFEREARIPLFRDGWPIFGMQKYVDADSELSSLFRSDKAELVLAPNASADPAVRSNARHHGDFDNDNATVTATLQRITGQSETARLFRCYKPASALRERRRNLQRQP